MQHLVHDSALRRSTISLAVATTLVSFPTSVAQAAPLDGVAKFATSSPLVTFGLGCAAGAVVSGLAVGLVGRHKRRRLEDEIDEVVATAQRAEESARRAEALLAKQQEQGAAKQEQRSTDPAVQPQTARPTGEAQPQRVVQAQPAAQPQRVAQQASHIAQPQRQQIASATSSQQTGALPRNRARIKSDNAAQNTTNLRRSRLRGAARIANLPVIDRGAVRPADDSPFVVVHPAPARPRVRQFDPVARATVINRRVPRFDESLYPDTATELHQDVDMFETAMRAMDANLANTKPGEATSAPQPQVSTQTTGNLERQQSRPDMDDTSAYIEYLVKDELELNRDGAGRRHSRAQLTVFEGTGDLSAARKAMQYRPRHMQAVPQEA